MNEQRPDNEDQRWPVSGESDQRDLQGQLGSGHEKTVDNPRAWERRGVEDAMGLGRRKKESGRAREFSGHAFHRTFLTVPPDNKVSVHTTASILDCGAEPASAANRTLTFSTRTMFPDDIPRLTMFKKRRNKSHGRGHSATEDTQASVCAVAVWVFFSRN